ncbi:hypothetical protein WR25_00129 [Diploscapter pachys]|uniref:RabBD domain-containing protein n=1 Tax=Diploscapter pachys TaxID=2018661 RepID=A0A2A2KST6_9BILA|nr:hypothetical protein WR25_00129 [Diploscapter pachys]
MNSFDLTTVLEVLTIEEQAILKPVLERDLEFQDEERKRLRSLQASVDMARKGSMPASISSDSCNSSNISSASASPSTRNCSQCGARLGFILNQGAKCKKCSQPVCDHCQVQANKDKNHVLCIACYKERELLAASGQWVPEEQNSKHTSELILKQIKKSMPNKAESEDISPLPTRVRPPQISRRNLTLPSIVTQNLLTVPNESDVLQNNRSAGRFWGGSPSPRSPNIRPIGSPHNIIVTSATSSCVNSRTPSPNNIDKNLMHIHPREIIGSPAPRSANPVFGGGFSGSGPLELPAQTVANPTRNAFFAQNTPKYGKPRRQSEAAVPTFQLSMC